MQAPEASRLPGRPPQSHPPLASLPALICDGKNLRGSAVEGEDGKHRSVAQVSVYVRALAVALDQKADDTSESHERAALQEPLAAMDLEGVLIQADALQTTKAFIVGAWPRGPTCSDRQDEVISEGAGQRRYGRMRPPRPSTRTGPPAPGSCAHNDRHPQRQAISPDPRLADHQEHPPVRQRGLSLHPARPTGAGPRHQPDAEPGRDRTHTWDGSITLLNSPEESSGHGLRSEGGDVDTII